MTLVAGDEAPVVTPTLVRDLQTTPGNRQYPEAHGLQPVATTLVHAMGEVDQELGGRAWSFQDPERRKALSRMRDFLQRLYEGLQRRDDFELAPLHNLATRASDRVARRGRENAWDLAEELRRATYEVESEEGLALLIKREIEDDSGVNYRSVFGTDSPDWLLWLPRSPSFRRDALEIMRRLHTERTERVRLERARDRMWQHFMWKLIPIVGCLLIALWFVQRDKGPATPVVMLAGALGSVLSAVLKVRDGKRRIQQIRRSMSLLLMQPMLGATAALVIAWVASAHLFSFDSENANVMGLLGFLAGYSEPFFLGTLGRLAEASSLKADSNDKAGAPKSKRNDDASKST